MRILDRYIAKSVIGIYLSCLGVFFLLYIVIDLFANLNSILKQQVPIEIVINYFIAFLPIIFVQVSPITALLATIYSFARLNQNNEIIAMRAAGLSVWQITKVAIIFGMLIALVVFWINDRFVPTCLSATEKLRAQIERGAGKQEEKDKDIITNLSMYGMKNRLFFVNKFSLPAKTMEQVIILQHDERQNITKKIVAAKGVYEDGVWRFYQSITYNFDENGQVVEDPHYMAEEIMDISESPQEFLSQRQRAEFMTIAQLDDYIFKLSRSGANTVIRNLKIDLYQKFTVPLTNIIIILLGIPFAMKIKKRAAGLASLGIAMMMGFLYFVLSSIGLALGKGGYLPAMLSVSLSHIIMLVTSIYLIRSLR